MAPREAYAQLCKLADLCVQSTISDRELYRLVASVFDYACKRINPGVAWTTQVECASEIVLKGNEFWFPFGNHHVWLNSLALAYLCILGDSVEETNGLEGYQVLSEREKGMRMIDWARRDYTFLCAYEADQKSFATGASGPPTVNKMIRRVRGVLGADAKHLYTGIRNVATFEALDVN